MKESVVQARQLPLTEKLIDFSSNDYLGIANERITGSTSSD